MKQFPSPLGDIYLGHTHVGLNELISGLQPSKVFAVVDDHTAKWCLPQIGFAPDITGTITIPSGEHHKTLDSCELIWSSLAAAGADRSTIILNIGGGMVCDLGGFAACCYQRGIRFAHIPTSLLAMADASIGGKTGVDFKGFKNYIGRFEAPAFIWIDPSFLKTLPSQEIKDGLAEVIKHAIIGSPQLWEILAGADDFEAIDWNELLQANIPVKKQIVEQDPLERGIRKTLNFGHTIGHALESYFLLTATPHSHGQAITLGMMAESRIARLQGLLQEEDFQRIIGLIMRWLRPDGVPLPPLKDLQTWLHGDKKKSAGRVGYSLPSQIGLCVWNIQVEDQTLMESLAWLQTQVHP